MLFKKQKSDLNFSDVPFDLLLHIWTQVCASASIYMTP